MALCIKRVLRQTLLLNKEGIRRFSGQPCSCVSDKSPQKDDIKQRNGIHPDDAKKNNVKQRNSIHQDDTKKNDVKQRNGIHPDDAKKEDVKPDTRKKHQPKMGGLNQLVWIKMPSCEEGRVSRWCNHNPKEPLDVSCIDISDVGYYDHSDCLFNYEYPYKLQFKYNKPITWYSPWVLSLAGSVGLVSYIQFDLPIMAIAVAYIGGAFVADKRHKITINFSNKNDVNAYMRAIKQKHSELLKITERLLNSNSTPK